MYLEFVSENTKLINNLRKLHWDICTRDYYTELKPDEKLNDKFYNSVKFINNLAIKGYNTYKNLKEGSNDKKFLDFFIANAYESEEFIWNQKGVMQCYYKEGLPWQRGSIIDNKYKNKNIMAILSSCVGDCLIANSLMNIDNDDIILWLGQEQQNFISTQLFTT
jgi:hypothetical protein